MEGYDFLTMIDDENGNFLRKFPDDVISDAKIKDDVGEFELPCSNHISIWTLDSGHSHCCCVHSRPRTISLKS